MPPTPSTLTGREIAVSRGGRVLQASIDLALTGGDLLQLKGPNGSGKSSLLRLLAGLLPLASGELAWDGVAVAQDPAGHRARLHLLGAAAQPQPDLTVGETLAFVRGVLGGSGEQTLALSALAITSLADVPAGRLSSGQKRRLALAGLMVAPRPLWLLDEPETGLDRAGRQRLVELIAWQRQVGGIVVVASHDDGLFPASHVLDLGQDAGHQDDHPAFPGEAAGPVATGLSA